jgi:hypothetical protein
MQNAMKSRFELQNPPSLAWIRGDDNDMAWGYSIINLQFHPLEEAALKQELKP